MTIEADFKASCQHTIPCYCGAKENERLRTELAEAKEILKSIATHTHSQKCYINIDDNKILVADCPRKIARKYIEEKEKLDIVNERYRLVLERVGKEKGK